MRTWEVWEHLVSIALRAGFGARNVSIQPLRQLGARYIKGKLSSVNVFPDANVEIQMPDYARRVIVDAKYKDHVELGPLTVANADTYEVLAFSRASSIKEAVLVYPCGFDSADPSKSDAGRAHGFSRIEVGDITIRAIETGLSGIASRGGLKRFVTAITSSVL